jgi:ACS family hexuronate transporter-like MFS transporter
MAATTPVGVSATETVDRVTLGWRIWIPCVVMAFAQWLSLLDRQIIAVLSPTIIADTNLTAQDYAAVISVFSMTYMVANYVWGPILDYIGLRIGMVAAVALWSAASASHAWMSGFLGFALARGFLGLGEGAAFPGALKTAVDSLPADRRARGIATSYSGGALGAILTPIIVVPLGLRFGWQATFLLSGLLGALWILLWWVVARSPYLPKVERRSKASLPNPLERRFWALVSSYAMGAFSWGPILVLVPLYLNRVLGLSQADLGKILWLPPLGWTIGYFVWGWLADRYASNNPRPVGLFVFLMVASLPLAAVTWTDSAAIVIVLLSWAGFIIGGFQMVALKAGSHAYPREQAGTMSGTASGAWATLNAILMPLLGRWFDQQRYAESFLLMALCPVIGVVAWLWLSREQTKVQSEH